MKRYGFCSDALLTRVSKIRLATGQNAGSTIGTLRGSEGATSVTPDAVSLQQIRRPAELPTAARRSAVPWRVGGGSAATPAGQNASSMTACANGPLYYRGGRTTEVGVSAPIISFGVSGGGEY